MSRMHTRQYTRVHVPQKSPLLRAICARLWPTFGAGRLLQRCSQPHAAYHVAFAGIANLSEQGVLAHVEVDFAQQGVADRPFAGSADLKPCTNASAFWNCSMTQRDNRASARADEDDVDNGWLQRQPSSGNTSWFDPTGGTMERLFEGTITSRVCPCGAVGMRGCARAPLILLHCAALAGVPETPT